MTLDLELFQHRYEIVQRRFALSGGAGGKEHESRMSTVPQLDDHRVIGGAACLSNLETIIVVDLDDMLASIVWEQLQPLFTSLRVEAANAVPGPADDSPPSVENSSTRAGDSSKKPRFLRVREERVDHFLDDGLRRQ